MRGSKRLGWLDPVYSRFQDYIFVFDVPTNAPGLHIVSLSPW